MSLLLFLALFWCLVGRQNSELQLYDVGQDSVVDLKDVLGNVSLSLVKLREKLNDIKEVVTEKLVDCDIQLKCDVEMKLKRVPRNCAEVYKWSSKKDGEYLVQVTNTSKPFTVYCDMTTDGGGWTVFQKRGNYYQTSFDNFYRNWLDYKMGFGSAKAELWLGNENLSLMTSDGLYELRVDLRDVEGHTAYAKYGIFQVNGERDYYRLTARGYSGTAGDSLGFQDGMKFSTKDRDNDVDSDRHCARVFNGAWWYGNCHKSNLNGLNLKGDHGRTGEGIVWFTWKGDGHSISHTEMKFRPVGF